MKQNLIVFDFDYTLYNAELWKELAYTALAVLFKKNPQEFATIAKKAYDQTRTIGYFDPKLFAEELLRTTSSQVTLEEILSVLSDQSLFQKSYYPETKGILQSLHEKALFAMFSTNDSDFQILKSKEIIHLFKNDLIFISKNKQEIIHKIAALTNEYTVYLVDDLLEILEKAKAENNEIQTVWIKQGPYATQNKNLGVFKPDKIIYNLHTLPEIFV